MISCRGGLDSSDDEEIVWLTGPVAQTSETPAVGGSSCSRSDARLHQRREVQAPAHEQDNQSSFLGGRSTKDDDANVKAPIDDSELPGRWRNMAKMNRMTPDEDSNRRVPPTGSSAAATTTAASVNVNSGNGSASSSSGGPINVPVPAHTNGFHHSPPSHPPATLDRKTMENALVSGAAKEVIEVQLSHKGLDDEALITWCKFALDKLPEMGAAVAAGPRAASSAVPRFALDLDFSHNSITDVGLDELIATLACDLRHVRVRVLKLHQNKLTKQAGVSLGRWLQDLGERPRESKSMPLELHLSHNQLGDEGIAELLDGVACAGSTQPAYPLSAQNSRRGGWQTLWVRVERNGQRDQPPEAFIREHHARLVSRRKEKGWLNETSEARMLCLGRQENSGCTSWHCVKQHGSEGPLAHISCWGGYKTPFRPKRDSSRPRSKGRSSDARLDVDRQRNTYDCGWAKNYSSSGQQQTGHANKASWNSSATHRNGTASAHARTSQSAEDLRSKIDAEIMKAVGLWQTRNQRPTVVMSAVSIGMKYKQKVTTSSSVSFWEGLRKAFEYFREEGVHACAVANACSARYHPVPPEIQEDLIFLPEVEEKKAVDVFLIHLAMELDCEFVDLLNINAYPYHLLDQRRQDWLQERHQALKLGFDFDDNGKFKPLQSSIVAE